MSSLLAVLKMMSLPVLKRLSIPTTVYPLKALIWILKPI